MTTKKTRILLATVSALSLTALSAFAHGGGGHRDPASLVKRFDANKNGKLEVNELPARLQERLRAADANKDGVLSADELKSRFEAKRAERKAAMDTDKDGKVSDTERAAYRETKSNERFARMDKNKDGFVTQAEAGKAWKFIGKADADKNLAVTRAEIQAAMENGTLKPHHGHHRGHGDDDKR